MEYYGTPNYGRLVFNADKEMVVTIGRWFTIYRVVCCLFYLHPLLVHYPNMAIRSPRLKEPIKENMISSTLEQDLKEYFLSQDSDLFENKLLEPLSYMAAYAATHKKVNQRLIFDGIVSDMISEGIIKFVKYFDETKGTAKATIYVMMAQYLDKRIRSDLAQKRNSKKTVYIEDIEGFDGYTSMVYEFEFDEFQYMKQVLLEKSGVFQRLKTKLNRNIAEKIIEVIKEPEKFNLYDNYVDFIAKCCSCHAQTVYETMKMMKNLLKSSELV